MPIRICEICNKEYSSGASYRVHKSRYHRVNSVTDDVIELEETLKVPVTPTPNPPAPNRQKVDNHDGNGELLMAGGAIVGLILLLLLGKK